MTDTSLLVSDLERDEGWRGFLYDDASGNKIVPGVTVRGHPTAAYGFALDVAPLTQAEALPILSSRAASAMNGLVVAAPWISALSEPRQRGLGNMSYNLGVTGLLKFNIFMGLMEQGRFDEAADDLEGTAWASQVGARATRIITLIRNG